MADWLADQIRRTAPMAHPCPPRIWDPRAQYGQRGPDAHGARTVGPVNGTKPAHGKDNADAVPVILGEEVENTFSTNGGGAARLSPVSGLASGRAISSVVGEG
jgi:hypothetical protein